MSEKLKHYTCSHCKRSKKAMHFRSSMIRGHEPFICNNCHHRYFVKIECMACKIEKSGTNFNRFMIIGLEDPYCHFCKATGKVILNKQGQELITYNRKCLMCDKEFETTNKFIRSCRSCKNDDTSFIAEAYGV